MSNYENNPYLYNPAKYESRSSSSGVEVVGNTVKKTNTVRMNAAAVPERNLPSRRIKKRITEKQVKKVKKVRNPEEYQIRPRNTASLSLGIGFFGLALICVMVMALGYVGYKYYSICAQAKTIDFQIAKAESKLAKAIELNDYKAEQLNDGFDLNYIYQYAVGKLGMVYPRNNMVVYFDEPDLSYVRQTGDIPSYESSMFDFLTDNN